MYVTVSFMGKEIGKISRGKDGILVAEADVNSSRQALNGLIKDYKIMTGGKLGDDDSRIDNFKEIKTSSNEWFQHLSEHTNGLFRFSEPMTETDLEDKDYTELMQDVDDYNERMDLMEEVDAYKNYVDSKYGEDEQSGVSEKQQ